MSKQVDYWLEISQYDLETAKSMLESKRFLYVGFMCHQSIEKILKCVYTSKYNKVPPKIHNLARLLKMVNLDKDIPEELLETLNELNPLNIATRYPDHELELIRELNYEYSSKLLEKTRRLFKWIKIKI